MSNAQEAWLSGPIEGVDSYLMPVAHSLVQVGEDLERAAAGLTTEELWARPGGAASIGFHLRHIAGVVDRLLTYASGEGLSERQFQALWREGEPGDPAAEVSELIASARAALDTALERVRDTSRDTFLDAREVGRAKLPSTVLGLLYHAADHATRHTGQIITTVKALKGEAQP